MSQDFEPQNGFEKSANFFLEAAQFAIITDKPRLAMHLYRAAYEIECLHGKVPGSEAVDGLRKAWEIACDTNDRSNAESIFGELSAFNTVEENEQAVLRLQSLALSQLEDLGITEMDIENIAAAVSRELGDEIADGDAALTALVPFDVSVLVPPLGMGSHSLAATPTSVDIPESADALPSAGVPTSADPQVPTSADSQAPTSVDSQAPTSVDSQAPTSVDSQALTDTPARASSQASDSSIASADPQTSADSQTSVGSQTSADSQAPTSVDSKGPAGASSSAMVAKAKSIAQPPQKQKPKELRELERAHTELMKAGSELLKAGSGLAKLNEQIKEMQRRNQQSENKPQINYQFLVGFEDAMQSMREFGFRSAGDESFKRFVDKTAAMHGVSPLSLNGSFLFVGPAREDTTVFAHATVAETGLPVVHVLVDLDKHGNGTIKLAGPFKRGLFGGPFDIMSIATPCIVLIENIDHLQKIFDSEQKAMNSGFVTRQMMGTQMGGGRTMQAEVTGYLRALLQRPGVILMASAEHPELIKAPLRELMGSVHEVQILSPNEKERFRVLKAFAKDHPSYADLDIDKLAGVSDGMSRRDLIIAGSAAVESAYRESLRTGKYCKVTLTEALVSLATYVDRESEVYKQIEEEAVAQFGQDIEKEVFGWDLL